MGETIFCVIINDEYVYDVDEGHHNQYDEAIKIALSMHKERVASHQAFYEKRVELQPEIFDKDYNWNKDYNVTSLRVYEKEL